MRRLVQGYAKAVRGALYSRLDRWAQSGQRADAASTDDLGPAVTGLRGPALRGLSQSQLNALSGKVAKATERHSASEFKRIGVKLRKEPGLGDLIDGWRKENVAKVGGLLAYELDTLEALLRSSEGRTIEELRDRIDERLDVTLSKAEYLARNQTSSLNAQITQAKHVAAGIEEFVWTTASDGRGRESHAALDGQAFRYDDPPDVDGYESIPGSPPNCRCVAYPVIPEITEDAEEAA